MTESGPQLEGKKVKKAPCISPAETVTMQSSIRLLGPERIST